MRFSILISVLSLAGVGVAGVLTGCGSDSAGTTGGSSSTSGGSPTTGSGSESTSASASTGTGADPGACYPGGTCPQVAKSECVALVDNAASTKFSLRMSNLTLTAPAALTKGLVKGIVQTGVTMALPSCNLTGGGTFSWLLQFDTTAGTLRTGGGKPAKDPTAGYSFTDETVTQNGTPFKIAPFTAPAPIKEGAFAVTMGQDVIVPIYLDDTAKDVVLLPLHDAKLVGTVSANNNCIGKFNSAGLDPAGGCIADDANPLFIGKDGKADSDGKLEGYITLEEADKVIVDKLGQSLCVLLTGDAAQYGDGGSPLTKCKRDAAMKITFQGDWCHASNDKACKDSIRLGAGFSASSVKVNN